MCDRAPQLVSRGEVSYGGEREGESFWKMGYSRACNFV